MNHLFSSGSKKLQAIVFINILLLGSINKYGICSVAKY
ncbi:hypothetical protein C8R21_10723 [Nitrosospira multiformis]|uniref:Uncharacterized protein n=1 Tax=Nitrosospira multiformis TaxID=1231 RepID=A0A2T5IDF4_9PROT|nr:hypothetical protein C8R21_10723 [Nitrosospira multiformis]